MTRWKKVACILQIEFYSEIRQKLKEDVDAIRAENEGFKPGLAIVQVTCAWIDNVFQC